jgi:hypothetical protein
MFRRSLACLIGVEGEQLFMSAVSDKKYLNHRLAILGKADADHPKAPLTDEELKRFTTSVGSAENLFNRRDENTEVNKDVVDEERDTFMGSNIPSPVRYGDWEYNGRCTDF